VRPIAQNLFTYLRGSPAQISFSDGDARTSLSREAPQNFDVIAVDAFSGDAIPLHLLTTEAIALYKKHLAPDGIVAFHVSNQYLNLAPEIGQLAVAANMQSKVVESAGDEATGSYRSTWVLLTHSTTFFSHPQIASVATATPTTPRLRPWTDDYSSLLPIVQLTHR
jgi:spermidine synthase